MSRNCVKYRSSEQAILSWIEKSQLARKSNLKTSMDSKNNKNVRPIGEGEREILFSLDSRHT